MKAFLEILIITLLMPLIVLLGIFVGTISVISAFDNIWWKRFDDDKGGLL